MMVPATVTPLRFSAVVDALCIAYQQAFGQRPSSNTIALAAGIVGLENAGGKSIVQNNFGNIMAGAGYSGDYWPRPTDDPNQPTRFRAYSSALDGAIDFWHVLRRQHRKAFEELDSGDPTAVVVALYGSSYVVGGDGNAYRNGVKFWAEKARGTSGPCMQRSWMWPTFSAVAGVVLAGGTIAIERYVRA